MNRHRSHRAFTITEILGLLILLGTVSLVMTRAFRQTTRILYDAPMAENAMHSMSAMLARLRADAWAASDVELVSRDHVTLRVGDVTHDWRLVIAEGRVVRSSGSETMSWPVNGASNEAWWFTNDADVLTIHVRPDKRDETAIVLPSSIRALNQSDGAK